MDSIVDAKRVYSEEAYRRAGESRRWALFFDIIAADGIEPWMAIASLTVRESASSLENDGFAVERVSKLLAATEAKGVSEDIHTIRDLVNWNKQSILAMMEVSGAGGQKVQVERGYETISLIDKLFPELLLEE